MDATSNALLWLPALVWGLSQPSCGPHWAVGTRWCQRLTPGSPPLQTGLGRQQTIKRISARQALTAEVDCPEPAAVKP
jgi:hypothetical protein